MKQTADLSLSRKNLDWKKIVFHAAPYSFFLVVFMVFVPGTLFFANIDEFMVDYIYTLPITIILIIAGTLIIWGMEKLFIRLGISNKWFTNLFFSLAFCTWIQVNFLNQNLPLLVGGEIEWKYKAWYSCISIAEWIIFLLLPFLIGRKHSDMWEKTKSYVSLFFSLMLLATIVFLAFSTNRTVSNKFAATTEGEFELANSNNLIVFVIDTFDAKYAEEYILQDEQYKSLFDGFVYYDNVVSGGARTSLGMPALLSGATYDDPDNMSYDEYYQKAYAESTLFKDLSDDDVDIKLYLDTAYLNHADLSKISNIREGKYGIGDKIGYVMSMAKLTAFCAAPYPCKQLFMLYTRDITKNFDVNGYDLYKTVDSKFYTDFCKNGLTVGKDNKAWILYHFFGAHAPYVMDENTHPIVPTSKEEGLGNQIHGCCKILTDYFKELKEVGKYDDATIIVMGDHGGVDLYQNPAVFVKYSGNNENKGITRDSKPATFRNIYATIAQIFLPTSDGYGSGLLDDLSYYETEGRYHTTSDGQFIFSGRSEKGAGRPYVRFKIMGDAGDPDSVIGPIGGEFTYGEAFDPNIISYHAVSGFSYSEGTHIWTDGTEAILQFDVDECKRQ